MISLQEAFGKLNLIESSEFDPLDPNQKDAMKDFLANEEEADLDVPIIDENAFEEDELEDSYVGKIIIKCPVCQSLVFKTRDEYDNEIKDADISCPYCFSVERFDLVGKIEPMEDEVEPEVAEVAEVTEVDGDKEDDDLIEESKEVCPDCKKEICECSGPELKEDLNNVTVETDNEIINVNSIPKDEICTEAETELVAEEEPIESHETSEVIAPIEAEINEKLHESHESFPFDSRDRAMYAKLVLEAKDEEELESIAHEIYWKSDKSFADLAELFMDKTLEDVKEDILYDIGYYDNVDEIDEESFDDLAESWLKENYSNVRSYRSRKFTETRNNRIKVEGVVTLANGKKRLTEFRLSPSKLNDKSKGTCLVENLSTNKSFKIGMKAR